jgi:hypothetical protein
MLDCVFGYLVVGCLLALAAHTLDDRLGFWKVAGIVAFWLPALLGIVIFARTKGKS